MKISGHNLKDAVMKTGYALIITLFVITSAQAESRYELKAKRYARQWCLNVIYEAIKAIRCPVYNGNIYMAPDVDPVTRRSMYIIDMRERRKVFMFIVVYEF